MSDLRVATIRLEASAAPAESPLPALREPVNHLGSVEPGQGIPGGMAQRFTYGGVAGVYPYQSLTGYGRNRTPRHIPCVVLENGWLTATFLPSVGGRLWSLVDRRSGRELLASNPWLQPVNIGLRNAWVSGGVEWNAGTRGHWPLTLDTLHTAVLEAPDGGPLLRMYEWERLRRVVVQIDVWLPADDPWLRVYVRVRNPEDRTVPMYWWSNAAVRQTVHTRVLAPATEVFRFAYQGRIDREPFPGEQGDPSYPGRTRSPADRFFDVQTPERPWIAAVQEDGVGLAQVSTPRLGGRKLFNWGTRASGRRWQRWLSDPVPYCEVQAGLTATQLEHLPLGPLAQFDWVELYGAIDLGTTVRAPWAQAIAAVDERLGPEASPERLLRTLATMRRTAVQPPGGDLHATGSGWGALEERRRELAGEPPLDDGGTPMPQVALGERQEPWLELLETGVLPLRAARQAPPSYIDGPGWERRLRRAPVTWETCLHRGHLAFADGRLDEAEGAYRSSLACDENAWAHHGLALLAAEREDARVSAAQLHRAWELCPDGRDLAVAALHALHVAGDAERVLAMIDALPSQLRGDGRVLAMEARAAVDTGQLERARSIVEAGLEVADLREGEDLLDQLWCDLWTHIVAREEGIEPGERARQLARLRHPLPPALDFRMVVPGAEAQADDSETVTSRSP